MKSRNAKSGRPRKPYRTSWGEHVNGLRRRGDGRWVIVETGKTFVEPDERLAVARYRRWEAAQDDDSVVDLELSVEDFDSREAMDEAFQAGASLRMGLTKGTWIGMGVPEAVLWPWFRKQLIERPELVAQKVGIPEVARLADLPVPKPSPTLKAIGQLYQDKTDCKTKQKRQVQLFWEDFEGWMKRNGATTLRQLTTQLVAEYGDEVKALAIQKGYGNGGSPKYLKNRFTSIRSVINFARKRGQHPDDVRHAIDCCAVFPMPKRCATRDPHPMSPDAYHALLNHVTEPRMRALILTMLNLCMYPSEALALDWGEIDLHKQTVVTDRNKTTVVRVGMLWPRTLQALEALRPKRPAKDAPVFLSGLGRRWSPKTVNTQYRQLRKTAGLGDEVKCEDCRDAAYTAAVESGADLVRVKLLAGHTTGISDYYAKRKPNMVADVIEAIDKAYFGSAAEDGLEMN
jgi:integrase